MNRQPALRTSIPTVSAVLDDHAPALGRGVIACRNHVYRVRADWIDVSRGLRTPLPMVRL